MKDHVYLYTVEARIGKDAQGFMQWERRQIKATSMVEVSRELKIPLEDLRYIVKVIDR